MEHARAVAASLKADPSQRQGVVTTVLHKTVFIKKIWRAMLLDYSPLSGYALSPVVQVPCSS